MCQWLAMGASKIDGFQMESEVVFLTSHFPSSNWFSQGDANSEILILSFFLLGTLGLIVLCAGVDKTG